MDDTASRPAEGERLLGVRDIMEYTGCSRNTAGRLMEKIGAIWLGRSKFVRVAAYNEYIRDLERKGRDR